MSPATVEWIRFASNLLISASVCTVAVIAERRASHNESIRARESVINDIRNWANEGIATLTNIAGELDHSISPKPESLRQLSSVIEQGRLFFTNIPEDYGIHKPLSHQGRRPRILSWLAVAHKLASISAGLDRGEQINIIKQLRGGFVSDCQSLIFPTELGSLTMKYLRKQLKDGVFMEYDDSHPVISTAKAFAEKSHEHSYITIL